MEDTVTWILIATWKQLIGAEGQLAASLLGQEVSGLPQSPPFPILLSTAVVSLICDTCLAPLAYEFATSELDYEKLWELSVVTLKNFFLFF